MVRQLILTDRVTCTSVPAPTPGPGEVLIQVAASAVSPGTERSKLALSHASWIGKARAKPEQLLTLRTKLQRDGIGATWRAVRARLRSYRPVGYAAAGTIIAVGPDTPKHLYVGMRVAAAGADWAVHADLIRVPAPLVTRLPDQVAFEEGCFATLGAIALHGVRLGAPGLGDRAVVIGLGMIGQLCCQLLRLSGARVFGIDPSAARRKIALELGAENIAPPDEATVIHRRGIPEGADLVIITGTEENPFPSAAAIARDRARIIVIGAVTAAPPHEAFIRKELEIRYARSYGPGRYDLGYETGRTAYPAGWVRWTETANISEVVRLMARSGGLKIRPLINRRLRMEDVAAYQAALQDPQALGIVLSPEPERDQPSQPTCRARPTAPGLALIGCGAFARSVILPALKNHPLLYAVSRSGLSAQSVADTTKATAISDPSAALADPNVGAVIIATRHDSHADLTVQALRAGKAVLVEKPLALRQRDIDSIDEAARGGSILMIGHNRRHAPMFLRLQAELAPLPGPKQVTIDINLDSADPTHWLSDPVIGGGRLKAEAGHAIDLLDALIGPLSLLGSARHGAEDVTALFEGPGGSATLRFGNIGESSAPKETITVCVAGICFELTDQRRLYRRKGQKRCLVAQHLMGDKGHAALIRHFLDCVTTETAPIVSTETALQISRLVLELDATATVNRRE